MNKEIWHTWFVWRPIVIDGKLVWMRNIKRKRDYYAGDNWGNSCRVPYWRYKF